MKRFAFVLTAFVAVLSFSSCSSDGNDDGPALTDQSLYAGDSVRVGSKAKVDNDFVAYVSSDGYLHAYHVGETTYSLNGKEAKVTVRGRYKAFDVITDWGISTSALKAKVGTPYKESMGDKYYQIYYKNRECANLLDYIFKDDKLICVMTNSSPSDVTEILNYLKERYAFSPDEVGAYTWAGVDAFDDAHIKTVVILKSNTSYKYDYMLQTAFMSYEYVSSASSSKRFKESVDKWAGLMFENAD
jgi:hypothetical protein